MTGLDLLNQISSTYTHFTLTISFKELSGFFYILTIKLVDCGVAETLDIIVLKCTVRLLSGITWLALSRSVITISISSALRKIFIVTTMDATVLIRDSLKYSMQIKTRNGWTDRWVPGRRVHSAHITCVRDCSERTHLENAGAMSIKLLSKFHLNPLIVNSITQTACMCACIHVFKCVCLCVWVCTCKPLNPGHTKTEGLH